MTPGKIMIELQQGKIEYCILDEDHYTSITLQIEWDKETFYLCEYFDLESGFFLLGKKPITEKQTYRLLELSLALLQMMKEIREENER